MFSRGACPRGFGLGLGGLEFVPVNARLWHKNEQRERAHNTNTRHCKHRAVVWHCSALYMRNTFSHPKSRFLMRCTYDKHLLPHIKVLTGSLSPCYKQSSPYKIRAAPTKSKEPHSYSDLHLPKGSSILRSLRAFTGVCVFNCIHVVQELEAWARSFERS